LSNQLYSLDQFHREKIYLHLDRTFFKPGEAIWFKAYVRDANTLLPSQKSNILYVEFIAPNGNTDKKIRLFVTDGVAAGDIQLHPDALGGRYKTKAYINWQRNFGEHFERDITVQASILPNLRMQLDFQRKAYGASDEVIANLELKSLENKPLKKHPFDYTVSLDGQQIFKKKGETNTKGKAEVTFSLPKNLTTNDGLLNILISWNGQTESIARAIPIVLNKIDLQFMPEGGNMIVGLPNRIAFKALNEFGKPADVVGQILDNNGQFVVNFKSYHQGMGALDFEAKEGVTYVAKITKPTGIPTTYDLPKVFSEGVNLKVESINKEFLTVKFNSKGIENADLVLHNAGEVFFMLEKLFLKRINSPAFGKFPLKMCEQALLN
jgi:hypothetical protein